MHQDLHAEMRERNLGYFVQAACRQRLMRVGFNMIGGAYDAVALLAYMTDELRKAKEYS